MIDEVYWYPSFCNLSYQMIIQMPASHRVGWTEKLIMETVLQWGHVGERINLYLKRCAFKGWKDLEIHVFDE